MLLENYSSKLSATSLMKIERVIFGLSFLFKKGREIKARHYCLFSFSCVCVRERERDLSRIAAKGAMTTVATAWRYTTST